MASVADWQIKQYDDLNRSMKPKPRPTAKISGPGVTEGWLRGVYNRGGGVDTSEGLKVALGPGVVFRNIPPSLSKRLFDLAVATELQEAIDAKKVMAALACCFIILPPTTYAHDRSVSFSQAWQSALHACERAKKKGDLKVAANLAVKVIELEETYRREQMEADNAAIAIRHGAMAQA